MSAAARIQLEADTRLEPVTEPIAARLSLLGEDERFRRALCVPAGTFSQPRLAEAARMDHLDLWVCTCEERILAFASTIRCTLSGETEVAGGIFDPTHHNRGLGSAVLGALVVEERRRALSSRMVLRTSSTNDAAIHIALRAGFAFEGWRRRARVNPVSGATEDVLTFSVLLRDPEPPPDPESEHRIIEAFSRVRRRLPTGGAGAPRLSYGRRGTTPA